MFLCAKIDITKSAASFNLPEVVVVLYLFIGVGAGGGGAYREVRERWEVGFCFCKWAVGRI